MNLEQARLNMIEQQIRPWDVLDRNVLDLLERAPRDAFVDPAWRRLAYADIAIPIGEGQSMLPPKIEARALQALHLGASDHVLEIGTGSGFLTWLLAQSVSRSHVTSIEIRPELAEKAKRSLAEFEVDNASVEIGDGSRGWSSGGPFDAIVVGGSVPFAGAMVEFERQLAIGGRLFIIVGKAPVMEALLVQRNGEHQWSRESLFETVVPPLSGIAEPRAFTI
ncbi:MAG: protein-L-isoaspartate O-methyltransferase [Ectothiorhodospiraceae bacterium AqS1]|nr:protein-L-isoaspartate O-methyltransferase [Ectothiorhodospiraceae bacterium AqS1]